MKKFLLLLALLLSGLAATASTYTAYYTNPNSWSSVCAYVWSDATNTKPLGDWNTTKANPISSTTYGSLKLWVVTFSGSEDASAYKIIFHNGSGSQTGNWQFYDGGLYSSSTALAGGFDPSGVSLSDYSNPEGECVVFFQNTDNWTTPSIYVFTQQNATELTGSWPGTTMTQQVVIDGTIYYTYTVTGVTEECYVMFADASNNSKKMEKTQLLHKGIYTPSGHVDGTGEVNYVGSHDSSSDTATAPETLYFYGNIYSGNWYTGDNTTGLNGKAMTKNGNVYTISNVSLTNSATYFFLSEANATTWAGVETSGVANYTAGDNQQQITTGAQYSVTRKTSGKHTEFYTTLTGLYNVTFDFDAMTVTLTEVAKESDITIYYKNSSTNWSSVAIHFWDSNKSSFSTWPGDAMTYNSDKDLWSYTFTNTSAYRPSLVKGFMFGDGVKSSGNKTNDYDVAPVDGTIYTCSGNNADVTIYTSSDNTDGGTTTAPETIYFYGNVNSGNWYTGDNTTGLNGKAMTKNGNVYTISNVSLTNSATYFFLSEANATTWDGVETSGVANYTAGDNQQQITTGAQYSVTRKTSGDHTEFYTTLTGNYNITFDLSTMELSIAEATGDTGNTGDTSDLNEYLVSGIPVLYINVYADATSRDAHDLTNLSDEILDKNLGDKNYRYGDYRIELNGSSVLKLSADLGSEDAPLPLDIKARGNFTRTGFAKKPFKLKLGSKQNLLGTKSKHYAILAHADDDWGFMRNFVGFNLAKRIGLPWASAECPVQVVINGDYRGLYFLTESIRVGDSRIQITELDDNAISPTDLTGGYLVELDNYEETGTSQIQMTAKGSTGTTPLYITPDTPEEYSEQQTKFITEQFSTMNDYIGDNNDALWSYMDLDDAARYYLVNEIVGHWEAYHGSTYLFRDKATTDTDGNITDNGKWHFSPVWDFGNAFSTPYSTSFVDEGANHFGNTWIKGLRENSKFNAKVKETWLWFMSTQYDGLINDINTRANLIKEATVKDKLRWPDGLVPTEGNASSDYRSVADNTDEASKANTVITYLANRLNSMKTWSGFGDYTSGTYSEPERDTTEAAELPDYVKAGYEVTYHTYTVYFKGQVNTGIWIWDAGNSDKNYTGGVWDSRPVMTEATDINSDTYYYYTFTTLDELVNPKLIMTWGDGGDGTNGTTVERIEADLVNGMLYYADGSTVADFDPDYFSVPVTEYIYDHNLSTDPVYIYVCDNAGWGRVDMWLYTTGTNYSKDWPGQQLTKDESLYYGDYTGLYAFNATAANSGSTDFAKNGQVIFSNYGSNQYPGANQDGLKLNGKSHIFFTADNSWVEVNDPTQIGMTYGVSKSIPVLCISTPNAQEIDRTAVKNTKFKFFYADDDFFTDANGATNSAVVGQIKGRGSSTWTDFNKKPYKIEFSAKQSIGDMPISKHWVLMPYAADQATGYIKNPLGHYLAKIVDTNWQPSMTGIELVINGEYKGFYFVAENIRPAAERVQIKDVGDDGYSAADDWILEVDKYASTDEALYSWESHSDTFYVVPENPAVDDFAKVVKKGYATSEDELKTVVADYGEAICNAIEKAGDDTVNNTENPNAPGYWDATWMDLIDAQTAVNFYLIQELMDDSEAYNTNLYLYHTSDSKWMFGPVWNFNGAFNSAADKSRRLTADWAEKLYLNRYFRVLAINTLDELAGIETPAESGNAIQAGSPLSQISQFINEYYQTYAQAIISDSYRWPDGEISTASLSVKASSTALTEQADIDAMATTINAQFAANASYLLNNGRDDNGGTTGIESLTPETIAPVEYFNLQGIRISQPTSAGIYIRRQGTSTTKLVIK